VQWETTTAQEVPSLGAQALWDELHADRPPLVIDVREPREFSRGHITESQSIPLAHALADTQLVPTDRPVVLVCRGGRRSTWAAASLAKQGYDNLRVLNGGILAWEQANLLEAIDQS
jgi:SulP family sulfate permease